ncbi:MAG TPA: hypothetical protein VMO00_05185 [Methylomirabilota bacterium]|nr:hypothetical protein [Methylomirabilota bacterium]
MDVVAHGLWGGALFSSQGRKMFLGGLLLGMVPDLLSFGPFFILHPRWLTLRITGHLSGPPPLSILPGYVFHAYNVTHSLVVWALSFILIWLLMKRPPWLLLAWALHIVCDIPTHTTSYFPTPFLWPFPTPFVNGVSWATPSFMIANYLCLIVVYAGISFYWLRGESKT